MFSFSLLQVPSAVAAVNPPVEKTEELLGPIDILFKGGFIMIPIAILSIVTVYIFVERFLYVKRQTTADNNFMNTIQDFIRNGNVESALTFCKSSNKPVARMIEKGISRIGMPIKEIEESVEIVGKFEVYKMEKNVPMLSIIAGIAPMLGFLGTILGAIKLFMDIAQAGGDLQIDIVANGLYTKLVTSAAGLLVGIMAYIFYNWINAIINKAVHQLELNTMMFLDLLKEPTR
ncbi:MAG: MotA/TolQ/ExbB proton channel family protein [Bacteroidetes bacterium]|nr:MotA/TolQ/ExbB proton channel family protein [Bacteroidota bacterium]